MFAPECTRTHIADKLCDHAFKLFHGFLCFSKHFFLFPLGEFFKWYFVPCWLCHRNSLRVVREAPKEAPQNKPYDGDAEGDRLGLLEGETETDTEGLTDFETDGLTDGLTEVDTEGLREGLTDTETDGETDCDSVIVSPLYTEQKPFTYQ